MSGVVWVVLFSAIAFGIGWFAVQALVRRGTQEYRRDARSLEEIAALSIETAAEKAIPLLKEPSLFTTIEREGREVDGQLGTHLRRLLRRYQQIESNSGSRPVLSRDAVGPSAITPGFLRVGSVGVGTDVEGELAIRAGEEAIYELYAGEAPDPVFGTYRSVYHWILASAEEVRS
jgi:hypothetical protein